MVQQVTQREKILGMRGIALALFLVSLDQTIVGTAMPRIIAELNGFELYAWVTTIYLLVETAIIPIAGKFGDIFGRKWVTVTGVIIFLIGSILCGIATNMPLLIAFRGVQGLGAGILFSTVFALVADIFPNAKDRARYQGLLFSVFALSSVIGPVLGGWITDTWSWRWVFYINMPLGALSLVALPIVLPQSVRRKDARIDYWGSFTMIVTVVALLLALETVGAGGSWRSPFVLGGLLTAVLSFVAFIYIEQRAAEPIIPLTLFRNRTFTTVVSVVFMQGIAMFGVILYTPLFVQAVLGQSASSSGTVMTPMVLTMTGMNIIVGQLIARFGRIKLFLILGTGLMSLGVLLLTTLDSTSSLLIVVAYLVVMALGLGMAMPVTTLAVQAAVERPVIGVATSATQFIRTMGSTVGTALIGTIVTGGYVSRLMANAPEAVPSEAMNALHAPSALVEPAAMQRLTDLMSALPNGTALTATLVDVARNALAGAIQNGFFFVLGAIVIAFVCSFFMANLNLDSQPIVMQATENKAENNAENETENVAVSLPLPAEQGIAH